MAYFGNARKLKPSWVATVKCMKKPGSLFGKSGDFSLNSPRPNQLWNKTNIQTGGV
jgi:hypothetical protein